MVVNLNPAVDNKNQMLPLSFCFTTTVPWHTDGEGGVCGVTWPAVEMRRFNRQEQLTLNSTTVQHQHAQTVHLKEREDGRSIQESQWKQRDRARARGSRQKGKSDMLWYLPYIFKSPSFLKKKKKKPSRSIHQLVWVNLPWYGHFKQEKAGYCV